MNLESYNRQHLERDPDSLDQRAHPNDYRLNKPSSAILLEALQLENFS
ncbi:MAG TPA: hypothetical protein ACQGQI_04700 [Xylella sp.]